jgi:hypothetical protein
MFHPEIFLNRIRIILHGSIDLEIFTRLVDGMLPIYSKHVTSYNDILPGNGPPFELLTLRLGDFSVIGADGVPELVPVPETSVHLLGVEGDFRFVIRQSYDGRHFLPTCGAIWGSPLFVSSWNPFHKWRGTWIGGVDD